MIKLPPLEGVPRELRIRIGPGGQPEDVHIRSGNGQSATPYTVTVLWRCPVGCRDVALHGCGPTAVVSYWDPLYRAPVYMTLVMQSGTQSGSPLPPYILSSPLPTPFGQPVHGVIDGLRAYSLTLYDRVFSCHMWSLISDETHTVTISLANDSIPDGHADAAMCELPDGRLAFVTPEASGILISDGTAVPTPIPPCGQLHTVLRALSWVNWILYGAETVIPKHCKPRPGPTRIAYSSGQFMLGFADESTAVIPYVTLR